MSPAGGHTPPGGDAAQGDPRERGAERGADQARPAAARLPGMGFLPAGVQPGIDRTLRMGY